MTQDAINTNTYKCFESIIDIEISLNHHRGTDKLYIITQEHRYMLDTGWRNHNKSYELAQNILAGDKPYTLTVWTHFPRDVAVLLRSGIKVYQVVDIRDEGNIYYDIDTHNEFQRSERMFGIISGLFLSVITVAVDSLIVYINFGRRKSPKDRGCFSVLKKKLKNN